MCGASMSHMFENDGLAGFVVTVGFFIDLSNTRIDPIHMRCMYSTIQPQIANYLCVVCTSYIYIYNASKQHT